jgi:hypothetical protein
MAKLMDKQWEETQKKTFTKWCNNHLVKKSREPFKSLADEFQSGIKLSRCSESDEGVGGCVGWVGWVGLFF